MEERLHAGRVTCSHRYYRILVGLLLPAVQQAREAARRMQCSNNVKQLALANHLHHDSYNKFPYGILRNDGSFPHPDTGKPGTPPPQNRRYPWQFAVLPYIEQTALYNWYDQFDLIATACDTESYVRLGWQLVLKQTVPTFMCPSNPGGPWNEAAEPQKTASTSVVITLAAQERGPILAVTLRSRDLACSIH